MESFQTNNVLECSTIPGSDDWTASHYGRRWTNPNPKLPVFRHALKQVTSGERGKEGDGDPSWSPDGASLAFGVTYSGRTGAAAIHVMDLKTSRIATLTGSEGMWAPRWAPNGRFIAGIREPDTKVVLYDIQTHKQSELSSVASGYPGWSLDGEYLFYLAVSDDSSWWRVRLRDRKTERVAALKNIRVGQWLAPAPDNSLITARGHRRDLCSRLESAISFPELPGVLT
jgi:dipeptidyl aminopeptidase/acylaminoacyl peptidase